MRAGMVIADPEADRHGRRPDLWRSLPDPTGGATYLIGPGDQPAHALAGRDDAIEPMGVRGHPSGSIQGG